MVVTALVAALRRRTRKLPASVQKRLPAMSAAIETGAASCATTASPSEKAAVAEFTPATVATVPLNSTRRMRFTAMSTTQKPPLPRGSTAMPRGPTKLATPSGPSAGGFVSTPSMPAATVTEPRWQRLTVPRVASATSTVCRMSPAAESEKSYDGSTATPFAASDMAATAYVVSVPLGDAIRSLAGSVNHVLPAASAATAVVAPTTPSVPTPKAPSSDVVIVYRPANVETAPVGVTARSRAPVSATRRKPDALSASDVGWLSCPTPKAPSRPPATTEPAQVDTFHTVPADELYASKASPPAAHVAGHVHAAAGSAPPEHQWPAGHGAPAADPVQPAGHADPGAAAQGPAHDAFVSAAPPPSVPAGQTSGFSAGVGQ